MVGKKNGKGKPGVLSEGKGVSKVEVEEDGEGLDPRQGGSGKSAEGDLVLDADASLMELSAEQRAVEKALEVQEELDTTTLENEVLRRELTLAKETIEKNSKKEQLKAKKAGLERRIAKAARKDDDWALKGGERVEAPGLSLSDESRSRSRDSGAGSPERGRGRPTTHTMGISTTIAMPPSTGATRPTCSSSACGLRTCCARRRPWPCR